MRVWGEMPDDGLAVLADYLLYWYPAPHEVVVYEASPYPAKAASIDRLPLGKLGARQPGRQATLYVPPGEPATLDPKMLARLGLTPESLSAQSPPA